MYVTRVLTEEELNPTVDKESNGEIKNRDLDDFVDSRKGPIDLTDPTQKIVPDKKKGRIFSNPSAADRLRLSITHTLHAVRENENTIYKN